MMALFSRSRRHGLHAAFARRLYHILNFFSFFCFSIRIKTHRLDTFPHFTERTPHVIRIIWSLQRSSERQKSGRIRTAHGCILFCPFAFTCFGSNVLRLVPSHQPRVPWLGCFSDPLSRPLEPGGHASLLQASGIGLSTQRSLMHGSCAPHLPCAAGRVLRFFVGGHARSMSPCNLSGIDLNN